jgi:hypothetical protein
MNCRSASRPVVHFQGQKFHLLLDINLSSMQIKGNIDETKSNRLLCRI